MRIITNRTAILGIMLMIPAWALGQNVAAPTQPASPAAVPAGQPAAKTSFLGDVWGEVDHIGQDMKSLFVRDKKGDVQEIKLGANANITKGGQKQGLGASDLKKGDRVKISHRGGDAQDVHVLVLALPPMERDLKEMANPRRFAVISRLYAQEMKIYDDAENGALDLAQAENLIARLSGIQDEERSLASQDGGHLDQKSYMKLQAELNDAGADRHDKVLGTSASQR